MSNVATVSFKIAPDRHVVLKAMAEGMGLAVSELMRRTVEEALELERQAERLTAPFAEEREGLAGGNGCAREWRVAAGV